jgi:FKBP-type peptidyl-prolyl cis-trans isomerase
VRKWAVVTIVFLFCLGLLFRKFRKKRNSSLVALSQNIVFTTHEISLGSGPEAQVGKRLQVHYVGRLLDGRVFDASRDRGAPFGFVLGAGRVIEGWEKGVVGMKVGGKRRLLIPAHMAYGNRGAGKAVPPGAALEFEIELVNVLD